MPEYGVSTFIVVQQMQESFFQGEHSSIQFIGHPPTTKKTRSNVQNNSKDTLKIAGRSTFCYKEMEMPIEKLPPCRKQSNLFGMLYAHTR